MLAVAASAVWLFGVRILVVPPIGAVPEGATVVVAGAPGLNLIDTADAFCLRTTGEVTLLCRGAALAAVAKNGSILLRLPYSETLDAITQAGFSPGPSSVERHAGVVQVGADLSCLRLTVDRVFLNFDRPHTIVTVTNGCAKSYEAIWVNCTWLKDDAPVATGRGVMKNLPPNEIDSEEIVSLTEISVDSARCRITEAY
jgi:hypothetical protein